MSMQAKFTASSFDAAQPTAFYLLSNHEGLEALSDATLLVADVELPVHSQVLSVQSKVLLDMFTALAGSDDSTPSSKKKAVLKEPFADCSLFEVALFLRFAYHSADLTPANLAVVPGSLLGLLRLAHKLDAQQILQAVAQRMKERAGMAATQSELLEWAEAAEQCCLPELRMRCLVELARRLASGGDKSLTATFSAVAALAERCDHSTLAVLLSLVTAGCGTAGANQLPALAPSAAAAEALEASANCGSFEWAFEHYSQLPSGVGDSTDSPYFQAAGFDWRFRIFPGGDTEESATYISVYVVPKQGGFNAKWSIAVLGQNCTKHERNCSQVGVFKADEGWGFTKFMRSQRLHAPASGFLSGDRLVLRATVEVTQRDVQPMAD